MATATISIAVDAEAARAFATASPEEQRKLQFLLGLRLRELTVGAGRPLPEIMNEMGALAEKQGLTAELLRAMLHDQ